MAARFDSVVVMKIITSSLMALDGCGGEAKRVRSPVNVRGYSSAVTSACMHFIPDMRNAIAKRRLNKINK